MARVSSGNLAAGSIPATTLPSKSLSQPSLSMICRRSKMIPSTSAGSGAARAGAAFGPSLRRLNDGQYLRSIEQVFGPGIRAPGRFAPPLREQGLLAIGEAHASVSPSGFEQYELRTREIAAPAGGARNWLAPHPGSAPKLPDGNQG